MESHFRKVQRHRRGGFFVVIPHPIARSLGLEKGGVVRLWSVNGMAVLKPLRTGGPEGGRYAEEVRKIREDLKAGVIGRRAERGIVEGPNGRRPADSRF